MERLRKDISMSVQKIKIELLFELWRHNSGDSGRQRNMSWLSMASLQSCQWSWASGPDPQNQATTAACAAPLPEHCPRAAIRMLEASS